MIAALDIGSTKVTCFVAQLDAASAIRVVGIGHTAARGMRNGGIVDMEAAEASILTAVTAAEQHAGERLREVVIAASGVQPGSRTFDLEMAIAGHEIADADLRRIQRMNGTPELPPDRLIVHRIPVGYSIDSNRRVRDPRGMYGERLGVSMHLVTAGAGALRNIETCITRCHLDIESFVVAPYAAGLAALVEDETDLGVTVLDMGGGTTSIAVFHEGHVIHTDMVPLGGVHVTNDIARGLSTPLADAERMKTLYGSALPSPSDEREMIDVPLVGEEHHAHANHVPRSMLVGIIRPRLEETFELVRQRLEAHGVDRVAGRRLVLTGGASQLSGVRELAALILEKQVRLGRPLRFHGLAEATSGPAFSVAAGLLRYAAENERSDSHDHRAAPPAAATRFARLGQWLKENF